MKLPLTKQITHDIGYSANLLDLGQSCSCLVLLGIWRSPRLYQVCPFELGSVEPPCTCGMCSTCMVSLFFQVLFGSTSWSNHAYFMHTHRYMILSLFTHFRGVGMKRPFRPTTFRDHLSKSSFLFSFPKNCIQQLPLPTSQARAGGSRQFKQVVVVDIAVVVVLVVVVVDLHLIHLV